MTLFFLLACANDNEVAATWTGGEFDFYTLVAMDECLGGALEALFMPEGVDTPHKFEYPIYIPGYEELPTEYTIDLREPFVEMPVNVEDGGDGWLYVRGSVMESVLLDEVKYGDCAVTMTADVDLLPRDDDTVDGQARIDISNPRGSEGLCPVFDGDPCRVSLDIEARRR